MSHFDFVRPSGQWPTELVPGSNDYQRWDAAQSKTIDGDHGGVWAPSKPIIIGGAGMTINAAASRLSGGIATATGGRVKLPVATDADPVMAFAFNVTDRFEFPVTSLTLPSSASGFTTGLLVDDYTLVSDTGLQTILTAGADIEIPRRYLHRNASLVQIALRFRVITQPSALPATQLNFKPFVKKYDASSLQPLTPGTLAAWQATHAYAMNAYVIPTSANTNGLYFKATVGGTSAGGEPTWPSNIGGTVNDGTVTWTATGYSGQLAAKSPAAYYNGGAWQSVVYTFDGTNMVDTNSYHYAIGVNGLADNSTIDPTGNLMLHSVVIDEGSIATLMFE